MFADNFNSKINMIFNQKYHDQTKKFRQKGKGCLWLVAILMTALLPQESKPCVLFYPFYYHIKFLLWDHVNNMGIKFETPIENVLDQSTQDLSLTSTNSYSEAIYGYFKKDIVDESKTDYLRVNFGTTAQHFGFMYYEKIGSGSDEESEYELKVRTYAYIWTTDLVSQSCDQKFILKVGSYASNPDDIGVIYSQCFSQQHFISYRPSLGKFILTKQVLPDDKKLKLWMQSQDSLYPDFVKIQSAAILNGTWIPQFRFKKQNLQPSFSTQILKIYDLDRIEHSDLQIREEGTDVVIDLKDQAKYTIQADYQFLFQVEYQVQNQVNIFSRRFIRNSINILRIYLDCQYIIKTKPSVQFDYVYNGYHNYQQTVFGTGIDYIFTEDNTLCPIESYQTQQIEGDPTDQLSVDQSTGQVKITILYGYHQFQTQIRACNDSLINSDTYCTNNILTVTTNGFKCKDTMSFKQISILRQFYSDDSRQITKMLASSGSDYLSQSNPSVQCMTNHFFLAEVDDNTYFDWLKIVENTGEIKAKQQTASFLYKIKVCVQDNYFDCLTSPPLSLSINIRCSPLIHFLYNDGYEIVLKGTSGSYFTAFSDHTRYASTKDSINCPLVYFDLLVIWGNQSAISMVDHGSGQVKVWASGGEFGVHFRACSRQLQVASIQDDCADSGTIRLKTEDVVVSQFLNGNSSSGNQSDHDQNEMSQDEAFKILGMLMENWLQEENPCLKDMSAMLVARDSAFTNCVQQLPNDITDEITLGNVTFQHQISLIDSTDDIKQGNKNEINNQENELMIRINLTDNEGNHQNIEIVQQFYLYHKQVESDSTTQQIHNQQVLADQNNQDQNEQSQDLFNWSPEIKHSIKQKQLDIKEKNQTQYRAFFKKINQYGLATIQFKLIDDLEPILKINATFFQEQNLEFRIEPSADFLVNEDHETLDLDLFDLDGWSLEYFDSEKQVAEIRLNFSNPLQISQGSSYDNLHVEFKSDDFQVALEPNSHFLSIACRKQQENSSFNNSVTNTTQSQSTMLLVILIISIVIYLVSQGDKSSRYMFFMIRSMQLITHLAMFKVIMQSNLIGYFEIMIPLLQFDILGLFVDWEDQEYFNFDQNALNQFQQNVPHQVQNIGYNSHNHISVLNTLAIIVLIYMIRITGSTLLFALKWITGDKYEYVNKLHSQISNNLFFQGILSLIIEGIFDLSIMTFFNLRMWTYNPLIEAASFAISWFIGILVLIVVPTCFVILLFKNRDELVTDQTFKARFGVLFEDLHNFKTSQILYYFFFLLRRIVYLSVAWGYPDLSQYFQIVFLILTNYIQMLYQWQVIPLKSKSECRLDSLNEFCVGLTYIGLFPLTPWNPDPSTQFMYSWLIVGSTQALIFSNMVLVSVEVYRIVKLTYVKFKNIIKVKLRKQLGTFYNISNQNTSLIEVTSNQVLQKQSQVYQEISSSNIKDEKARSQKQQQIIQVIDQQLQAEIIQPQVSTNKLTQVKQKPSKKKNRVAYENKQISKLETINEEDSLSSGRSSVHQYNYDLNKQKPVEPPVSRKPPIDDRSKPYNIIIDKGESIEFNWPPYEPQVISYSLGYRHAQKLKEKYPHLQ